MKNGRSFSVLNLFFWLSSRWYEYYMNLAKMLTFRHHLCYTVTFTELNNKLSFKNSFMRIYRFYDAFSYESKDK